MEPKLGFCIGSDVCPGLSKLIEECGEVMQVAGKLIATGGGDQHWDGSSLYRRIHDELADLIAAATFYIAVNGIDIDTFNARVSQKLALFNAWHIQQKGKVT